MSGVENESLRSRLTYGLMFCLVFGSCISFVPFAPKKEERVWLGLFDALAPGANGLMNLPSASTAIIGLLVCFLKGDSFFNF